MFVASRHNDLYTEWGLFVHHIGADKIVSPQKNDCDFTTGL